MASRRQANNVSSQAVLQVLRQLSLSGPAPILQPVTCLLQPPAQGQPAAHAYVGSEAGLAWSTKIPPSCDPCVVLDSAENQTRKKGTLEQQLSLMVLGRPTEAPSTSGAAQSQQDAAAPSGTNNAQGKRHGSRGLIKRWQVESFYVVLNRLAGNDHEQRLTIVDFGCGTGSLLLPLAACFAQHVFVGVEMKPAAVAILLERAKAAGLTNVSCRCSMIEDFDEPFDVALALHACGNATDSVLLRAVQRRAAYIVSPCCVGKLKFSMTGGSSFSPHMYAYTPRMPGDRPAKKADAKTPVVTQQQQQQEGHAAKPLEAPTSTSASAAASAPAAATAAAAATAPPPQQQQLPEGAIARDAGSTSSSLCSGAAAARPVPASSCAAPGAAVCVDGGGGPTALPPLQHPRSAWLRSSLPDPEAYFRVVAKLADGNHAAAAPPSRPGPSTAASAPAQQTAPPPTPADQGPSTARAAALGAAPTTSRHSASGPAAADSDASPSGLPSWRDVGDSALCKLVVELDRSEAAREAGYCVAITKTLHWEAMAKSDLLVGVPSESAAWADLSRCLAQ